MSRKKPELDPGVLAALSEDRRRRDTRGMSEEQKQKYDRDRRWVKKTYRVDRAIVAAIEIIAEHYGTTGAGVLTWLLLWGLMAITEEEVDPILVPSDSPRWDNLIRMETADIEAICHAARERFE